MKMEFKTRLKELRKARHMTQSELGKHLCYGYTAIANYESGKNQPSIQVLIKLSELFDVSVDYLLGVEKAVETRTNKKAQRKELAGCLSNVLHEWTARGYDDGALPITAYQQNLLLAFMRKLEEDEQD